MGGARWARQGVHRDGLLRLRGLRHRRRQADPPPGPQGARPVPHAISPSFPPTPLRLAGTRALSRAQPRSLARENVPWAPAQAGRERTERASKSVLSNPRGGEPPAGSGSDSGSAAGRRHRHRRHLCLRGRRLRWRRRWWRHRGCDSEASPPPARRGSGWRGRGLRATAADGGLCSTGASKSIRVDGGKWVPAPAAAPARAESCSHKTKMKALFKSIFNRFSRGNERKGTGEPRPPRRPPV